MSSGVRHSDATTGGEGAAAALVHGLAPLVGQCGVLVGVGGQPLLLEAVDSSDVFTRLWRALLASVALDALGAPAVPTPGRRARRFLDRLLAAPRTTVAPAGDGLHRSSRSPWAEVRSLSWQSRTVHFGAVNVRHPLLLA